MMQKPAVIRLIIYTLTIIPFSISFSNKRELILVLIVIMFCEAVRSRAKISLTFRTMLLGIVGFSTFLFFITVMSIMRGYGGFAGADTLWSAIPYILPYVSSDLFLSNFADNLEVSHTLPALVLPIEYAIESRIELLAGATIIKPIFLPFPAEIFWFARVSDKNFHARASPSNFCKWRFLPVPFLSETFMNFHLFGLIVYACTFLIMERVFKRAIVTPYILPKTGFLILSVYFFVVTRGVVWICIFCTWRFPLCSWV